MSRYEFVGRPPADFASDSIESGGPISAWESFRNHREIVTGFICSLSPPLAESLCVLGAGHCNDIDLPELLQSFDHVTLVDLDRASLESGLKQQHQSTSNSLTVVGELDICGVSDSLASFSDESDRERNLDQLISEASEYFPQGLSTYDCVASTCLLSQLLCHATASVGDDYPQFVPLLTSIRKRHIEIMVELLKPGGTGLLITDFVSSISLPELLTTTDLKSTLKQAVAENNFLHGLNPAMVTRAFADESIRSRISKLKLTDPWRWAMPDRFYACFAIAFSKLERA